jgi:hypothetical protein
MAKILLVTGMMVGFAYGMEFFIAWYGANEFEWYAFIGNRANPETRAVLVGVLHDDLLQRRLAAALLVKKFRQNPIIIWIVALFVTIGMWFERFVIIVTSLHRAFLPGEWHMFYPTPVDILTFVGSIGIFMTLFLLFIRFMPIFPMAELKAVMPQAHPHEDHHGDDGHGPHDDADQPAPANPMPAG